MLRRRLPKLKARKKNSRTFGGRAVIRAPSVDKAAMISAVTIAVDVIGTRTQPQPRATRILHRVLMRRRRRRPTRKTIGVVRVTTTAIVDGATIAVVRRATVLKVMRHAKAASTASRTVAAPTAASPASTAPIVRATVIAGIGHRSQGVPVMAVGVTKAGVKLKSFLQRRRSVRAPIRIRHLQSSQR